MRLKSKIIQLSISGCILLLVSVGLLSAQNDFPMEKIFLKTDRDLYVAGEQVHFKLYTFDATSDNLVHCSDIVYLELLDRQQSPLVQKKFTISAGESSGTFTLPYDLVSEHYYVRAYTSWMKNAGATAYAFQLLTVLNPFGEILPETIASKYEGKSNSISTTGEKVAGQVELSGVEISVRTDQEIYGSRQKVVLEIETRDMTGNPVEASLLLSVARKGLLNPMGAGSLSELDRHQGSPESLYPPEWGGHLITGKILHRSNGDPIAGDTLIFSVVGREVRMDYSISDRKGNFTFLARNLKGLHEIVVQNLNPSKSDYQILLDDPFSADFAELQLPPYYIDTTHLMEINRSVIIAQIQALYAAERTTEDRFVPSLSFYGIPEKVVNLADYIRLPEMREVFFELIPDAQMRGREDQTIIRAKNVKWGEYSFRSLPLLLVDGVVSPDPLQIVELDARKVDRIDVVTSKYHYGVLQFIGILSIFTVDGRCPITYPEYYFRQSYDFLSPDESVEFPVYPGSSGQDDPKPDYRNALYWDPDIRTDQSGRASVEFYTSDDAADYILMVEGFTPDGLGGVCFDTISVTGRK